MNRTLALLTGFLLLGSGAFAQDAPSPEKPQQIVTERLLIGDEAVAKPIVLLGEMDGIGKVVKGAPYTATATTETTQTLSDGNRIINKTTASLARDNEGRTRREENFTKVGNLQSSPAKAIMINDPVAHTEYMVQPKNGSGEGVAIITPDAKGNRFYQMRVGGADHRERIRTTVDTMAIQIRKPGGVAEPGEEPDSSANLKHESLGTQVIEGVTAEGTRDTRTIPAGAIGNEKPIVITSETWTSPELQVVVLSKRNDPRFGETVYKLSDINRSEPDPALFQLPEKVKKDLPPLK